MPEPSTRLFYGRLAERYHLAVFGVSAVGEYDTSDALRAALELTRRLPSTPRVGVETGEAVIGAGRPARSQAGRSMRRSSSVTRPHRVGIRRAGGVPLARDAFSYGIRTHWVGGSSN